MREAWFDAQLLEATPRLKAFARKLTGSGQAAEDLTQDTILSLLAGWASFRPGSNFAAWASTIMRNAWFSQCRRKRRVIYTDKELWQEPMPPAQLAHLELADVLAAMDRLPESQREALTLASLGGSYEEIAAEIAAAIGTVKSRVCRARASLLAAEGHP